MTRRPLQVAIDWVALILFVAWMGIFFAAIFGTFL